MPVVPAVRVVHLLIIDNSPNSAARSIYSMNGRSKVVHAMLEQGLASPRLDVRGANPQKTLRVYTLLLHVYTVVLHVYTDSRQGDEGQGQHAWGFLSRFSADF